VYSTTISVVHFCRVLIYFGASANEGSEAIARWSGALSLSASTYTADRAQASRDDHRESHRRRPRRASVSYATANVTAFGRH